MVSAEVQLSINLREVCAVKLGLQLFQEHLRDLFIVIFFRNVTLVSHFTKSGGSRFALLNQEAQKIHRLVKERGVTLLPQFIVGETL